MPVRISSLIILLSLNALLAHAGERGYWKPMPPVPTARTEASVTILDDRIYILGGFAPDGVSTKVEMLDIATGRWTERAPLPQPLHHTTASAVNGKIYVIGGFATQSWTPVATVYEYDPAADRWKEKQPMPTARGALAAGIVDGRIYAVGGAYRKALRLVNTNANEVYDPVADKWETRRPIPTARDHLAVSPFKGILYAIGGRIDVDYNDNLNVNEAYDPAADKWTTRKPLSTARSGITSQVLQGKIFVLGGESGKGTFRENAAYDPGNDTWTAMEPMSGGHHGLGSAVYRETLHVLTGGPNPGGGGSKFYEIFSLSPFK